MNDQPDPALATLARLREESLQPGTDLGLIQAWLNPDFLNRLLLLQRLVAEVATIPDAVNDAGVAAQKLEWWREEMDRCIAGQSRHPVCQALQAQGLHQRLAEPIAQAHWQELLSRSHWRLGQPLLANESELEDTAQVLGAAAVGLESLAAPDTCSVDPAIGRQRWLVRMIRDLAIDARNGHWWVPMDLQARFQLRMAEVASGSADVGAWNDLVRALGDKALAAQADLPRRAGMDTQLLTWYHLQQALDRLWLQRVMRQPERLLHAPLRAPALSRLWTVWREARRCRRAADAGVSHD